MLQTTMATAPTSPRRAETRKRLIKAATEVVAKQGFHEASVDDIARRAGYSIGALYNNFAGKDDLFLAVLDAQFEQRVRVLTDVALDENRLEDSYRAVARSIVAADRAEPRWTPLLLEFWAHASRRDSLRAAVAERREEFFNVIAGLIDELGSRHGVEFAIPAKEVARGSNALARGIALDWLLAPTSVSAELFEEMHTAFVTGLTRAPAAAEPAGKEPTVP
jgi:AcrR family transcriptional regulator